MKKQRTRAEIDKETARRLEIDKELHALISECLRMIEKGNARMKAMMEGSYSREDMAEALRESNDEYRATRKRLKQLCKEVEKESR